MVCVGNCSICGHNTLNSGLCTFCKDETSRRALSGESVKPEDIKKAVRDIVDAKHRRESLEMLEHLSEQDGRNDWRNYRDARDDAFTVIDQAIAMIENYGEDITEMQSLKKILEGVDTGRETKKRFEKAKEMLRKAFTSKDKR